MTFSRMLVVVGLVHALHRDKSRNAHKVLGPDDDEYDFAEDDNNDPADFSVDQFLDDDSFVQTKAKTSWVNDMEADQEYFDSVAGDDSDVVDSGDDEDNDAFLQVMAKKHLQKLQSGAPDDDEFDFADDHNDDPADFSVDQFLDDNSFVQRNDPPKKKKKKQDFLQRAPEDDTYSDERLGGGDSFSAANQEASEDDEASLLQVNGPDDDEFDFAGDMNDDPADFSVDQFLDDDSFVQTGAHGDFDHAPEDNADNRGWVSAEEDADDDDDDDMFVQVGKKPNKNKHIFLQGDFNEAPESNPDNNGWVSAEEDADDDEDGDMFLQVVQKPHKKKAKIPVAVQDGNDDEEYSDDRLAGGNYMPQEMEEEDEEDF